MEAVGSFIAGELLATVKHVAMKNFDFHKSCQNLQRTLEGLIPLLERVNLLSYDEQKPFKEFNVKLQAGKKLLDKCSTVWVIDILRVFIYANEIERFNQDIVEFTQTIGWAINLCEILKINNGRANLGARFDEMQDKLDSTMSEIQRMMKEQRDQSRNGESASPSSIPKFPDCSDGLQISVGERTKLETAFRNDQEFQGIMKQNPARQYGVFLNYRGKDTKNLLASPICHQLKTKDPNLRVFLDKEDISSGVNFELAIETAIQCSSVHIAIFSEGYAESKWCLHELDVIIKSRGKLIPVFCDVDPAALRRIEKGCYREAFEKHRGTEPVEDTKRWEDALATASCLQGLVFKMKECDHWKFVEEIVNIVLMILKEGSSLDDKYPVEDRPDLSDDKYPVEDRPDLSEVFLARGPAVSELFEVDEDGPPIAGMFERDEDGPPIAGLFELDEDGPALIEDVFGNPLNFVL